MKTPAGVSEKEETSDVIMQGESISSIICTTTVDKVSKDCKLKEYEYKNAVKIPKLGFVDNMIDITKCGSDTKRMNEYTIESMN